MVEQPLPGPDGAAVRDLRATRPDFHAGIRSEFNRLLRYLLPALVVSLVLAFIIGRLG